MRRDGESRGASCVAKRLARDAPEGEALSAAARDIAMRFDAYWEKAKTAPAGAIDVIDMFSGCGGMSAGFRAVNALFPAYRLCLAVDIDDDSNGSYEVNLGLSPVKRDIAEVCKSKRRMLDLVEASRRAEDRPLVMIGCAPCQGFSSHRNAAGENDIRNSLFIYFAKIVATVGPDAVVVENVPEILTDRYWPIVAEARRILGRAGYRTIINVHDMAEFGVPQHRYRALMIGMKKSFRMPAGFVEKGNYGTVRQAIGYLPRIEAGEVWSGDPMHFTARHRASTIETIEVVPKNGGSRPYHAGPACLRRAEAKQGRAAYEDVYGRLWWDKPAITVTAYARNPASGRYVHPEQNRGLSVREAALLQSFPKDYRFEGSFDSRFRQIGNAVPPAFAAFLATHLIGELRRENEVDDRGIEAPLGPSFSRLIPALKAGFSRIEAGKYVRTRPERGIESGNSAGAVT